ncbi:MAG: hypothetical protein IJ619_10595 [Eubacterium sp.]|nr:hypothetical protein [Eubacterium sp.]
MSHTDEILLFDSTVPSKWQCPHCNIINNTGTYADDILIEIFKYLEHCENCGYVHIWTLTLTEGFKRKVVEQLLRKIDFK